MGGNEKSVLVYGCKWRQIDTNCVELEHVQTMYRRSFDRFEWLRFDGVWIPLTRMSEDMLLSEVFAAFNPMGDVVSPTPLEGRKNDQEKNRLDLLPFDALEEVGQILTLGAAKYGVGNWRKGMAWHRLFGAALRHLWAWYRREETDPESGRSHLAHAACCVLFLLSYTLTKSGEDDRP